MTSSTATIKNKTTIGSVATKTANFTVPNSVVEVQQEDQGVDREGHEESFFTNPVLITFVASGLLILLAVIIVLLRRRRLEEPSAEERSNVNPIYGLYHRGWGGEGDYGDGDETEFVDRNAEYARMDYRSSGPRPLTPSLRPVVRDNNSQYWT